MECSLTRPSGADVEEIKNVSDCYMPGNLKTRNRLMRTNLASANLLSSNKFARTIMHLRRRYVGAAEVEDDGEPFEQKMKRLAITLEEQFTESAELERDSEKSQNN